jgi:hypothetical protein
MKNVIKQELKRYRLYTKLDDDFFKIKSLFYKRLRDRGYSEDYLTPLFLHIDSREELLNKINMKVNSLKSSSPPLVITTQVPILDKKVSLSKLFQLPPTITESSIFMKYLKEKKLVIGSRAFKSIQRLLTFLPICGSPKPNSSTLEDVGEPPVPDPNPRVIPMSHVC